MLHIINSAYFRNLVDSITNGIIIFNTRGDAYVINAAALSILRKSRDECMGEHWEALFSATADPLALSEYISHALGTSTNGDPFHCTIKRKQGPLYLNVTASKLTEEGVVFGVMVMLTDVTDIYAFHEREREMLQERSQLDHERYSSLHNLASAVAHQIRNPMMTIGGFANILLRKRSIDASDSEFLNGIIEADLRLESIVKAVSEFTSLSLSQIVSVETPHLFKYIREILETHVAQHVPSIERKVNIEIDVQDETLTVDMNRMGQAFLELLKNACETMNPDVLFQIKGKRHKHEYVLTVTDNGPGIAKDILPFVTDPFYTTKAVGIGMGLSLVDRIIKEHGGKLTITSPQGKGAVITMNLPLGLPGR